MELVQRPTGRRATTLADAAPLAPARTAVALHRVSKVYPNGRRALDDVDLVIPEGAFVFLVGPSGAGKSTLIKLLVRDEVATEGEVKRRTRTIPVPASGRRFGWIRPTAPSRRVTATPPPETA